ncbi:hypothetical protein [Cellvibrio sp. NN19]|uniref:hypothetical protein n=1 Tax=Cellvibrio chitinivorans TaxID=3102792 RepID=UPI002B407698|nr:hypothetical protein [Cellvibrio sp. NN19]
MHQPDIDGERSFRIKQASKTNLGNRSDVVNVSPNDSAVKPNLKIREQNPKRLLNRDKIQGIYCE